MLRLSINKHLLESKTSTGGHYEFSQPPSFICAITIVEIVVHARYALTTNATMAEVVLAENVFTCRSDNGVEIWRFLSYALIHESWKHLFFNMLVQLIVGVPLEMVHGSLRVGAIYMAGVLAVSLGQPLVTKEVLVGASGGCYALMAGHAANAVLNYRVMGATKFTIGIPFIGGCDTLCAVYSGGRGIHLLGMLAGLTIGLLVLKIFEQKLHSQVLWWVALGI